ncbi:unnamed protein product [Rotaria sordida]|uniref:Uncharacterized protein n=1 Tax=Rotaria sordida TaxID=392033 RepID=A0A814V5N7_9BILA|nr:unnamed protein product [Rotaria sordida]CAF1183441.1 unnamed protein product [Rotaria sordida]CAF3655416.1 unnamed protein product [Rotaria sordida]CAF3744883.1 unnamed protein product [Rotaria sordida]
MSCILPNSYWPLLILVFYIFLPIPLVITTSCNQYDDNTGPNELAIFITAVLLVSTFGLLIVIYFKGYIHGLGLSFALTGNITFIGSIIIYALLFHRKTNEFN